MTICKTITASVEGAQIIVDEKLCQLQEYNFVENRWYPKAEAVWPLPRACAEEWLSGWNHADWFAAMNALTGQESKNELSCGAALRFRDRGFGEVSEVSGQEVSGQTK
jgi:hypothetical protein